MIGVYLSGTGNTRHCIQKFLTVLDSDAKCVPIEDKESIDAIRSFLLIRHNFPMCHLW